MSRKTVIIILIVSVGLNVGLLGAIVYDALEIGHRLGSIPPFPSWIESIGGLSDEQHDKIRTIMTESIGPIEEVRADLEKKRGELTQLLSAPQPDIEAINAKIDEISAAHGRMERLIVSQLIAIRGVLTPEQQEVLLEHMSRYIGPPPGPPGGGRMMHERGGMKWRWGHPDR
jgi:uncharacterized membrane protein